MNIAVDSLSKSYGRLPVLKSVSFTAASGRITGLVGPNACGKTTLTKILLGLVHADSGSVAFGGTSIADSYAYRESLGYMPQNADFPANIQPLEAFRLLSALRGKSGTQLQELLSLFDLEGHLEKPFGNLSTGTRQKFAAVAACMFNPEVLILDEPTAGLDPVSSAKLRILLSQRAAAGTTILIVSHLMSELEHLISDIVFLLDGNLLYAGTTNELKSDTQTATLESSILALLDQRNNHQQDHGRR